MLLNPAAVRHLRELNGFSQRELARVSGVTHVRINQIEETADFPDPTPVTVLPGTAKKLADALKVPLSAIRVMEHTA